MAFKNTLYVFTSIVATSVIAMLSDPRPRNCNRARLQRSKPRLFR